MRLICPSRWQDNPKFIWTDRFYIDSHNVLPILLANFEQFIWNLSVSVGGQTAQNLFEQISFI
jgi:hypothetical protein